MTSSMISVSVDHGKTQLIKLVEDLARNTTSGKQTGLILLYFSKAFDEVNHLKPLYKLQIRGVQGKTRGWYPKDRFSRNEAQLCPLLNLQCLIKHFWISNSKAGGV